MGFVYMTVLQNDFIASPMAPFQVIKYAGSTYVSESNGANNARVVQEGRDI